MLEKLLVNEWHLGDKLGRSVNNQEPSSFHLYLAMMSQYLLDQAEFQTPKASVKQTPEIELAKSLGVMPSEFLSCNEDRWEIENRAELLANDLASLKLDLAMRPAALAVHNDKLRLGDDVLHALSHHELRHHKGATLEPMETHEQDLIDVLDKIHGVAV